MHKRFLLLFLCTIGFMVCEAQRITGCGFKVPPRSLRSNFSSVYEAKGILQNMLNTINWQENFNIREQNGIQNAYATIINRSRWIIYDNRFLEDLDTYTSTKWASVSVLAHEMGHHYYNHVVSSSGSTPPKEIEADAFSGYIMAKLGATLQESVAAMQAIASDRASATHPAKNDRVQAITRGWNESYTNGNTANSPLPPGNSNTAPPATPSPSPGNTDTNTDPNSDPSWIWLTIQSSKNEVVLLSDDGKNFQPAEIKAGEPFVFKFEIYNYGWLRLKYFNGYRTFKLMHGKDYSILWNRRTGNWTVAEVGQ